MRVLIMANKNRRCFAPFVAEQGEALAKAGVEVVWFGLTGHGVGGYLRNLPRLCQCIRREKPDLIHAHYGLCGLVATLQRRVPVVVTYHGSDINTPSIRKLSRLAMRRAAHNIFVSNRLQLLAGADMEKSTVLPCGVDTAVFHPGDKDAARRAMGLAPDGCYILFAGAFDNTVKNAPLAQAACRLLPGAELKELQGYTRQEVAQLMTAADALLITSFSEGSPQVVKEALAVGLPVVSVDVGDVRERIAATEGCFVADNYSAEALAEGLRQAIQHKTCTAPDSFADVNDVAATLVQIYSSVVS